MTTELRAGATSDEFDRAAPRYDLLVALNPGYHRHLRAAASRLVRALPRGRGVRLADLGCGSGASTRALLAALAARPLDTLLGVDASAGMLDQARRKSWPAPVRFVHGRAEDVAALAADATPLDGIFAAYLFRNVAERDATLAAVRELLAPGGTLVVQEYSVAGRPAAQLVWTAVCWLVVVPLALLTSGRARLYRYLWRSVLDFDSVERFSERLRVAGFTDIEVTTVGGWQRGILHTFAARRPA